MPSSRRRQSISLLLVVLVWATIAMVGPASAAGRTIAPRASGVWQARYDGPANGDDTAVDLVVSTDGSTVAVTGYSDGQGTGVDYATAAYDAATGAQRWAARFTGSGTGSDVARDLAISPDGSFVVVTGESYGGGSTFEDYATVAYDTVTGAERWVARYNGSLKNDWGRAVAVSSDSSTVFVTGSSGGNASADYATVAYDAATGEQRWAETYSGPGANYDSAEAVAVDPVGGTVVVTGASPSASTGLDYATVAYDPADGTHLWVARYNRQGSGNDHAWAIAVSPDGSTVGVTGSTVVNVWDDYTTVAYDIATGHQRWASTYSSPGDQNDLPRDIAVTPDSSTFAVTGWSLIGPYYDYGTVAYDTVTGSQRWVALYDGPAHGADFGEGIEASPDGSKVVVTGYSNGVNTASDYAVVSYDPSNGTQQQVFRAGRQYSDWSYGVGISPDGSRIFAGGSMSRNASLVTDYVTVAFAT